MKRWEVVTDVFWADGRRTQKRRRCFTHLGARLYSTHAIDWKFVTLWNSMWPDERLTRYETSIIRAGSNQEDDTVTAMES